MCIECLIEPVKIRCVIKLIKDKKRERKKDYVTLDSESHCLFNFSNLYFKSTAWYCTNSIKPFHNFPNNVVSINKKTSFSDLRIKIKTR